METDKEVLSKIVSERADKIQSEATEQIKRIQIDSKNRLSRVVPDLMKQIEDFSLFKSLDVLDSLREGGIVKTGDYENSWDNTHWSFMIGNQEPFYKGSPHRRLDKGRYRITLIMEKLAKETE